MAGIVSLLQSPLEWSSWTFVTLIVLCVVGFFMLPEHPSAPGRVAREVLLMLPAGLTYFLVRGLVNANPQEAFAHASQIVRLERWLGVDVEEWLQDAVVRNEWVVRVVNWIYIWGHWPVVIVTLVWLVACHRDRYPGYRSAMLLSGAVGMLIFAVYPVAPPRLVPDLNMFDTVTSQSHAYRVLQPTSLTNQYAALPSLHFGWNLLIGIAIFREAVWRPLKVVGLLLPLAMFSAIVLSANHYIIDGLAGGMLVLLSLALVEGWPWLWARACRLTGAHEPAAARGRLAHGNGP